MSPKYTLALIVFFPSVSQAVLTWTGASNNDFGTESNWIDSSTMLAPPAGTVDHEVQINNDLEITNATVSVPQHYFVFLGDGQKMTVTNSQVSGSSNTNYHPNNVGGNGNATIILDGSTTFSYGWSWDITWSLEGTSHLIAQNSNTDPHNGVLGRSSAVNFASMGTSFTLSRIDYTNDSQNRTAFLSKLTVLNAPAVVGENLLITSHGENGTTFTPIPEPSSAFLILTSLLGILHRRR